MTPAPWMPRAGRAAMTEGTRGGSQSARAPRPAPRRPALPTPINSIDARTLNDDARLAPTCNVVATTSRTDEDQEQVGARLRFGASGRTGRCLAACTALRIHLDGGYNQAISYKYRMAKQAISITLDAEQRHLAERPGGCCACSAASASGLDQLVTAARESGRRRPHDIGRRNHRHRSWRSAARTRGRSDWALFDASLSRPLMVRKSRLGHRFVGS